MKEKKAKTMKKKKSVKPVKKTVKKKAPAKKKSAGTKKGQGENPLKTEWNKTEDFHFLCGKTLTATDENGVVLKGKITKADSICNDSYWGKMVLLAVGEEQDGHGFLVNVNEINKKKKVITNYKCKLNNCTIKIEN